MRNRNPFSKPSLPDKHDWIDGGKIGAVSAENFFAHIWNTYTPWKINGKISPEKQFLIDIEYDGRPALSERGGVPYTNEEISEITDIMGRDQLFLKRLRIFSKRLFDNQARPSRLWVGLVNHCLFNGFSNRHKDGWGNGKVKETIGFSGHERGFFFF